MLDEISGETTSFNQQPNTQILFLPGEIMGNGTSVSIQKMPLSKIKLSKNSRRTIGDDELSGMMESIKEVGLLQPIGVTKNGSGYEICYGNRRYLACSKLGLKSIPVIVHEGQSVADIDMKNLTENIQRRNITLTEAGRYIQLLENEGLKKREIAVRLGVTRSYVEACVNAFRDIPEKFRSDLEVRTTTSQKADPGKIPVHTALKILSAVKKWRLNEPEKERLFLLAKTKSDFSTFTVDHYASQIKSGTAKIAKAPTLKHVTVNFVLNEDEFDRLEVKYCGPNGQFKKLNGLFKAILSGKKSEQVRLAR